MTCSGGPSDSRAGWLVKMPGTFRGAFFSLGFAGRWEISMGEAGGATTTMTGSGGSTGSAYTTATGLAVSALASTGLRLINMGSAGMPGLLQPMPQLARPIAINQIRQ